MQIRKNNYSFLYFILCLHINASFAEPIIRIKQSAPLELKLLVESANAEELKLKEVDYWLAQMNDSDKLYLVKTEFYKKILGEFSDKKTKGMSRENIKRLISTDPFPKIETQYIKLYEWLIANFKQDLRLAVDSTLPIDMNKLGLIIPWMQFLTGSTSADIAEKFKNLSLECLENIIKASQIQLIFSQASTNLAQIEETIKSSHQWQMFEIANNDAATSSAPKKTSPLELENNLLDLENSDISATSSPIVRPGAAWTPKQEPMPIDDWHNEADFPLSLPTATDKE